MSGKPIRVLVAEGSTVIQKVLTLALNDKTRFEVVAMTADGSAVASLVTTKKPDVLLLGFGLNKSDVWEVLPAVMRVTPLPTVVLRSAETTDLPDEVERLSRLGAVAVARKPAIGQALEEVEELRTNLTAILERAANIKVMRLVWQAPEPKSPLDLTTPLRQLKSPLPVKSNQPVPPSQCVVLVGSSTGGPTALVEVLRKLDASLAVPVVIAQHMPDGLITDLARYLNSECRIPVVEARNGDLILPGTVYMCPGRCNIRLIKGGVVAVDQCLSKLENSPSVDMLFNSGASVFGRGALAIVLTGMGDDGADGVRTIKAHGGTAIAQDESSCVVYGMPKEAAATGLLDAVLDVRNIGDYILSFARGGAAGAKG